MLINFFDQNAGLEIKVQKYFSGLSICRIDICQLKNPGILEWMGSAWKLRKELSQIL